MDAALVIYIEEAGSDIGGSFVVVKGCTPVTLRGCRSFCAGRCRSLSLPAATLFL